MSLLVSTNKQNDLFCYHNSVDCNSSCNRQIYLSLVWYSHVIGSKKLPCISVVPKRRSFSRTQQIGIFFCYQSKSFTSFREKKKNLSTQDTVGCSQDADLQYNWTRPHPTWKMSVIWQFGTQSFKDKKEQYMHSKWKRKVKPQY